MEEGGKVLRLLDNRICSKKYNEQGQFKLLQSEAEGFRQSGPTLRG